MQVFCVWKERLTEPVLRFFWAQEQERNGFDLLNPLTERERNGFENLSVPRTGTGTTLKILERPITSHKSLKLPTLVEELVGELLSFPAKSPGVLSCLYNAFPSSEVCPRISDINGQCACPSETEKQADLLKSYENDPTLINLDTFEH